jgi:hypothetical protein
MRNAIDFGTDLDTHMATVGRGTVIIDGQAGGTECIHGL